MKVFITGGAGFIGSHIAEFYAKAGDDIIIFDNLSRGEFSQSAVEASDFNWNYLSKYSNIKRMQGEVRDYEALENAMNGCTLVYHTAAQTLYNSSIADPVEDFTVNALGTFNVLETARRCDPRPAIIYTSTSKVYGINVNKADIIEKEKCFEFTGNYANGIKEDYSIDGIGRTPFGCSKLTGDLYMQEYAHLFGLKIGVFRLSSVYGERSFGIEEQGWLAKIIADTLLDEDIHINGSGKQTRDPLYIDDAIKAFDAFFKSDLGGGLFNLGGGVENSLSRLQLLDMIEAKTGKRGEVSFDAPVPYEQKIFISDNSKAQKLLKWKPETGITAGISDLIDWTEANL